MAGRLEGKVAIVTGGASGIGAATARMMAQEGAQVLVSDINGEGADAVAAEIDSAGGVAAGTRADMGEHDEIEAMVELAVATFGGLDVLFNNAAAMDQVRRDVPLLEMPLDAWERQLRVNLTGPMLASRFSIPHMIRRGGGSIVHTASVSGMRGQDGYSGYNASKAGLAGLSRSIAVTYGKEGIRSNAIAPGVTLSAHVRSRFDEAMNELWLSHTMVPDLGRPEDQAAAVVFLASDEARFITGQLLPVDGGLTVHLPIVPQMRAAGRTQPAAPRG
jgi:NAD(P)-dependent dehydrogenase (short-subunit alcohol dehydrogenase family)